MSRVLALVEGHTEVQFVKEVLAPALASRNVYITARMAGKPGRRGGVRAWSRVSGEIATTLKEDTGSFCTTMFDYYGLQQDWPGLKETKRKSSSREAVELIESRLAEEIDKKLGAKLDPGRFTPYIQLHEYEALLFSDTSALAGTLQNPNLQKAFDSILEECGNPEEIDDGKTTAPSKRIQKTANSFQKTVHGIIAAKRIGLDKMREKCPHFGEWLKRLEQLGQDQEERPSRQKRRR